MAQVTEAIGLGSIHTTAAIKAAGVAATTTPKTVAVAATPKPTAAAKAASSAPIPAPATPPTLAPTPFNAATAPAPAAVAVPTGTPPTVPAPSVGAATVAAAKAPVLGTLSARNPVQVQGTTTLALGLQLILGHTVSDANASQALWNYLNAVDNPENIQLPASFHAQWADTINQVGPPVAGQTKQAYLAMVKAALPVPALVKNTGISGIMAGQLSDLAGLEDVFDVATAGVGTAATTELNSAAGVDVNAKAGQTISGGVGTQTIVNPGTTGLAKGAVYAAGATIPATAAPGIAGWFSRFIAAIEADFKKL